MARKTPPPRSSRRTGTTRQRVLNRKHAITAELYKPPFALTGRVLKVTFDVSGEDHRDADAARRAAAEAGLKGQ